MDPELELAATDGAGPPAPAAASRSVRADARRNADAVLEAARTVFATTGVGAPVREVAANAGVGTATVYRHFPQRSDLVTAVFRSEVDACADAAPALMAAHAPWEALERWLLRYSTFIRTKQGLTAALHSGDPAFDALPEYFDARFEPVLRQLLTRAEDAGEVRRGVDVRDLLRAVANLCHETSRDRPGHAQRMVALLLDGLRHGAPAAGP